MLLVSRSATSDSGEYELVFGVLDHVVTVLIPEQLGTRIEDLLRSARRSDELRADRLDSTLMELSRDLESGTLAETPPEVLDLLRRTLS
ncbi:MAG: hypothetical protein HY329_16415 [Chloroflexi bacterium]|nr:hypothetical protein [Chloroflexota bacterium]